MAKVRLARGIDAKITDTTKPTGLDGRLYISTDRYKIYTDIADDKRIELNQGILIPNLFLEFDINSSGAKNANEIMLSDYTNDLDISSSNFVIMVYGKNNYYENNISCTAVGYNSSERSSFLSFERTKNLAEEITATCSVFIYDAANNRNFSVTPKPEEIVSNTVISSSSWGRNEDGTYSARIENSEITEDDLIILGSGNANAGFYNLSDAIVTDGAIIINSKYKLENNIELYIHQLPKDTPSKIIDLKAESLNNGPVTVEIENLTTDSTTIIQCLDNIEEYNTLSASIADNNITFTANTTINNNISMRLIYLSASEVNNIEAKFLSDNWTQSSIGGIKYYTNTITLNTPLECGGSANNYEIAPIIVCLENEQGYTAVTDITISSDRKGITCHSSQKLNSSLVLSILDFKG